MKNAFVSMVSHELRTPLTSIRGSLSLLLNGLAGPLNPEMTELLDISHRNSERLFFLINDILDIEKMEAGKMDFRFEQSFAAGIG
jgi:signal transduction histidine kinase